MNYLYNLSILLSWLHSTIKHPHSMRGGVRPEFYLPQSVTYAEMDKLCKEAGRQLSNYRQLSENDYTPLYLTFDVEGRTIFLNNGSLNWEK